MGIPVVTIASGGMAVVVASNGFGTPVTEATNGLGRAVTTTTSPFGMPVVYEGGGGGGGNGGSTSATTARVLSASRAGIGSMVAGSTGGKTQMIPGIGAVT